MRTIHRRIVYLSLSALAFAVLIGNVFAITIPTNYKYQKIFGSHVEMAHSQSTFEGIESELKIIDASRQQEFKGSPAEIYNSPWYWDFTYDNSLSASDAYFAYLFTRIDDYEKQYDSMVNNPTQTALLQDWYAQAITNIREEMGRKGNLDWVIANAWVLHNYPQAYWLPYYMIPVLLAFLAAILIVGLQDSSQEDRDYQNKKYEEAQKARNVKA